MHVSDSVTISVPLHNTGTRKGTVVVQLYFQQTVAPVVRYTQQLVRYARVSLEAGESTSVAMKVAISDMSFYDANRKEPGWSVGSRNTSFVLMAGTSAATATQTVTIDVAV